MDMLVHSGSDALNSVFRFLQTIGIVEVRRSLELVGVHHVEVVAAIVLFVLLQFTKFTAVLLLACFIAFCIFYMWETWFPELREGLQFEQGTSTTYGAGYGPPYEPKRTYANNYGNNDARTSALFPPFGNNESNESKLVFRGYNPPNQDNGTTTRGVGNSQKPSLSGSITPVGYRGSTSNVRPQRRPYPNQFDEYRRYPMERDNQLFRKMIANEYRLYRPGTATEHQRYSSSYSEDQRLRRPTSTHDETNKQQSNRRSTTDNKSASQKKPNANEQSERSRTEQRKPRSSQGTSERSGVTHNNRYDPAASQNNSDNKTTKKRSGLNLIAGTFKMDKDNEPTSSKRANKPSKKENKRKCDCKDDPTSRSSDTEIPAINSNGSYPYVIEMVPDGSSAQLVPETVVKSNLKKK